MDADPFVPPEGDRPVSPLRRASLGVICSCVRNVLRYSSLRAIPSTQEVPVAWSAEATQVDLRLPPRLSDFELSDDLDSLRTDANDSIVTGLKMAMVESVDGQRYPPRIDDLDPPTLALWRAGADAAANVALAARLCDLSWTHRLQPRPDLAARRAVRCYLDLARSFDGDDDGLYRVQHAQRARELAGQVHDRPLLREVLECLLELGEQALAADQKYPGVVLRALTVPPGTMPAELSAKHVELIRHAVEAMRSDPFNFESAVQLLMSVEGKDGAERLGSSVVERWLLAADEAEGLVSFAHRRRALEQALLYGLGELASQIRVQLQDHGRDDLGLELVHHEGELAGVDEFLRLVVNDSFIDTFKNLSQFGPASGDRESNLAAVQEQRRVAPIQALVTRVQLGVANSVIWEAPAGTPARDRYDLAATEQFRMSYLAALFGAAIEEARSRFGDPSRDDLRGALTTQFIDNATADALTRGILLALQGDFDAGVNVLLPRIEGTIRRLVQATGQAVIVEPKGNTPGGVRTLGTLLGQLEGRMDEDLRRYFVAALVDPLASNIRNRALHGLWDAAGPSEFAILVHILSVLVGLETSEEG